MDRKEFMRQLAVLLRDLPDSERMEAIRYYNDYFDEAGPENESQVIQELGSPGKVAAQIRADGGQITEEEQVENPLQEIPNPSSNTTRQRGTGKWALIIILVVFASPLILGIGGGIFGVLLGILGTVFGILVSLLAAGAGLVGGGVALMVKGVIRLISSPASGLLSIGGGMIALAIGIFAIMLLLWAGFRLLPRLIRAIVNFISRLLHKRKGASET